LDRVALLVEQVGKQDPGIRIRVAGRDQLFVLGKRAVEVAVQDAALGTAFYLDRLIQCGSLPNGSASRLGSSLGSGMEDRLHRLLAPVRPLGYRRRKSLQALV